MSSALHPATVKVYQLKVSLRDISPLIWRRLLVTSDTSIAHLHAILQIALGWEDVHLHRFHIHGKDYGSSCLGGIVFNDNPHVVRLSAFKLRARERFLYEYDMGDGWQHDIRLERVLPLDPRTTYPVCTAGAGDCPPEDCGGPWGYRALLAEHYSLLELLQAREDVLLVAQRLLEFHDGGPRPTTDDTEFMAALDRMRDRLEQAPIAFDRLVVNKALHELSEATTCTSASK
ncbi:MAG TPA: plasmid pRiA4b ORF-3 family protein [Herpetosiphonaceae bacterium]|nr:plasmid pRiA4b ORF-3 family protein [Herpetosiphonaceae bacterium]